MINEMTGTKGINMILYIRLGIARATKKTVMKSPRYKGNVVRAPIEEIRQLIGDLDHWVGEMERNKYATYYMFLRVFGQEMAERVGRTGEFEFPH